MNDFPKSYVFQNDAADANWGPPLQLNSHLTQRLDNPIIRNQFLPSQNEINTKEYELFDPINDDGFSPLKGLIHRYCNRVLIKVTNQCEAYCRFCFRREFVGTKESAFLNPVEFKSICNYLMVNPHINEVIFSGGDPLILSARRLKNIMSELQDIGSITSIRIHTRLPILAPKKITDELMEALLFVQKPINIVVHSNHFSEIDNEVEAAITRLNNSGLNLFSQSVLLAKINDDADTLAKTFNRHLGVSLKPYYLHHLDFARGTSHFAVPLMRGLAIYRDLKKRISGIALPAYVLDLPNGSGKVRLSDTNVRQRPDGHFEIYDNNGNWQFYTNIEL